MRKALIILITFLYIFPLHFRFLPISCRIIFAVIGGYFLLKDYKFWRVSNKNYKEWKHLYSALIFLLIISLVSSVFNFCFDLYFFLFPFSVLMSLVSAYGYIHLVSSILHKRIDSFEIVKSFIFACLLQCFIAVTSFIIPSFRDSLMSLILLGSLEQDALDNLDSNNIRLLGFGTNFFGAGILMGLSIIFTSTIIVYHKKRLNHFIYLLFVLVLTVVGSFMARTTMVGCAIFLLYLFLSKRISFSNVVLMLSMVVFVGYFVFDFFINNLQDQQFAYLYKRAFSMFDNLFISGEIMSKSEMTGEAKIPDNILTWIIGDGKMSDPRNPGVAYYMGIDIGLWRIIYCLGVIGFVVYSVIQYIICKLTSFDKTMKIMLFLFYLLLINKGMVNMSIYLSPFIMLELFNSRRKLTRIE